MYPTHFRLRHVLSLAAALLLPALAMAEPTEPAATFVQGTLFVTVPYNAGHVGAGRLELQLLDPEDHVLASTMQVVAVGKRSGHWSEMLTPAKPVALEDLVWERLRYRFIYAGESSAAFEGTEGVGQILRRPGLHVLGQKSYLAGSRAAVRVILTGSENEPLPEPTHSAVRIELLVEGAPARLLYAGHTDARGTCDTELRLPAGVIGAAQLHILASTAIGSVETTQAIQLEDTASVLLTTEKPIYQPGQTIHVRALVLDRAAHHAVGNRPFRFELEDSRGNKVFRKATQTDAFGIASAEFGLADEVNLGTYHLRAVLADPHDLEAKGSNAQLALNVERYVLPKFKVSIELAQKDGKPQRDFRPGDKVSGTVQANYFFGKPVDGAPVTVKALGMDVQVAQIAVSAGKTDKGGLYRFEFKLPTFFAGRPLTQDAASVLIEATVTDAAAHAETRGEPITVSGSAMLLTAIPEGGKLVPGLDNRIFVLASYADGEPAIARLIVHCADGEDQQLMTDDSGIAIAHLKAGEGTQSLRIEAIDRHGARAESTIDLQARGGSDQLLLRAAHAVYRAGDRIELEVLSNKEHGAVYIDLVKDGQTVLTRDLELDHGRATLALTATAAMAGTLDFSAYLFGRDAQPIGDHRVVFVQPADELKIETVADAQQYKPGADAHIRFHVTNARGEGVSAALGLQVVDEAVFALAEKQPGFAKVFFYLEQELMTPRFEIHSLAVESIKNTLTEPTPEAHAEQHDRAAQVLFSAMDAAAPNALRADEGQALPQAHRAAFDERYRTAFEEQVEQVTHRLAAVYKPGANLTKTYARMVGEQAAQARDSWGTELRVEPNWNRQTNRYAIVRSAGPDRRFDTQDDLTVLIEAGEQTPPAQQSERNFGGSIEIRTEHDRGPATDRAEIEGDVADVTGAVVPRAHITIRPKFHNLMAHADVPSRSAASDAQGHFTLAAVPAGEFLVEVMSPGFMTASRTIRVVARDRAVLAVKLQVGAENSTVNVVTVNANVVDAVAMEPALIMNAMAAAPMAMGAARARGMALSVGRFATDGAAGLPIESRALKSISAGAANAAAEPTHIRSYFPEALYINPAIVTDGNGRAEVEIPMADSITTWRMAMLASTQTGILGSATSSLKVFQDFFVDLDLPITLTQGDRVTLPVALYNYTAKPGEAALTLQPEDWFSLVEDTTDKTIRVDPNRVGGSQYTIEARHIGKFKLTLSAHLHGAADRMDTVVREIEVVPNGQQQDVVFNGRLDGAAEQAHPVTQTIRFPQSAIPEASKLFVRLYPGPLSQIMEGMDGILRMPGGCFEQTSSSTYPNVLALDYMKRTKKLTPEVHARAEGYIANGYQRLLTFEVAGGGFSWFGQAPANKILTAYGLMEFHDMAQVYDVDPKLIERTRNWLVMQQQNDGSWKPDTQFINEGATNRFNTDVLRITVYIAWSLEVAGYRGPALEKARGYIANHLAADASAANKTDAYTLAVLANFGVDGAKDSELTHRILRQLMEARTEQGEHIFWSATETGMYGAGKSAAVETTGLAAQALLKSGESSETARKALAWLTAQKGPNGNWGTTQATIMALRALLLASERSGADALGSVDVRLNGKTVQNLTLTQENNDLLQQIVLPGTDASANEVELRFTGTGGVAYQIAGRYFTPWPPQPQKQALEITVAYDRTTLARNDVVAASATIHSHLEKTANMVMVDLGIPPGFDLLSEGLQDLVEKTAAQPYGRLEKFSLTATQAILYFNAIAPNATLTVPFRLRAKYPIRAKTFASHVYEYYDPSINAIAQPVQLEVKDK